MQEIATLAPHKISLLLKFVLGGSLLFVACACGELDQQQTEKVNKALSDSLLSTTETWNVDMQLIEEGHKKVHLTGSYATSYNSEKLKETHIKGPVHIQVFDGSGSIKTWVSSDRAIYRSETSEFEFFGDVKVRTREKRRLTSEYLKWEQSKNSISTPKFVIITTPVDSIAGTGFSGASDLSSYIIKKPSGRFTIN